VIASFTISIGSTVTGIHTLLIAAGKSCGTFWVSQTLIRPTFYIGTAFVAWRTLAFGSVPVHSAKGFDSTLLIRTRILTLSLDASLSEWALIITLTTRFFTDAVGISLIPLSADADCSVPLNPAFSIDSTGCGEAGVLALFSDTCKVIWTFWVSCTFRSGR